MLFQSAKIQKNLHIPKSKIPPVTSLINYMDGRSARWPLSTYIATTHSKCVVWQNDKFFCEIVRWIEKNNVNLHLKSPLSADCVDLKPLNV